MNMLAAILLKGTVTTFLALAGARLARKSRAAVRHMLLATAFATLLVLPVASIVSPVVSVPVPAAVQTAIAPLEFEAIVPSGAATPPVDVEAPVSPATRASAWPSWASVLITVWAVGTVLSLFPLLAGMWQIRALRRSSRPWPDGRAAARTLAGAAGVRRQVGVLVHAALPGPMTCGVLSPVIVLPMDAPVWSAEDIRRALVHELEHVRRADWLVHGCARAICAAYWFHPLVWIALRRLELEAERACDDAVLRSAEATGYADQLINLAERLSAAAKAPLLAMANRRDLATRIGAVLDRTQRRGRAGAVVVASVASAAVALLITLSPVRIVAETPAPRRQASGAAAAPARFAVASIKPCDPNDAGSRGAGRSGGASSASPGRLNLPCMTLQSLAVMAYINNGALDAADPIHNYTLSGMADPDGPQAVRGGPAWVRDDKYTISAEADGTPDKAVMAGPMLRTLLEERFQLKLRRGSEDAAMYALTTAKGGFKMKPIADGDCMPIAQLKSLGPDLAAAQRASGKTACGSMLLGRDGPNRVWTLSGASLRDLAVALSGTMDLHVIDKTGIAGLFNFRLEFAPDDSTRGPIQAPDSGASPEASAPAGPSILTALDQQLGLKLEKTRAPRDYFVIDHVQRPVPNEAFVNAAGPQQPSTAPAAARFES